MAAEVSSEAIVLRRSDSGEADRRLTLFTPTLGKLDVVAKGARKSGSRLAGSSEPLVRATFTWAEGKLRRFVTQVQPATSFPRIRLDYDLTLAALALAELVAVGVPYESPAPEVYDLLGQALGALDHGAPLVPTFVWAQARLLDLEGVHPDWTVSAVSGGQLSENPAWVSPFAGGHVRESESLRYEDRFRVSAEALIALRKIVDLDQPPAHLKRADECARTLFAFWRSALEHRLPANESFVQTLSEKPSPDLG
ncbi:MAG: DNA repair protein RecO [Armatimonadetes bacterium]|nr:DNA repair protein RecO [Armatimonadota bacterium]